MRWMDVLKWRLGPWIKNDPVFAFIRYQRVGFWEGKTEFAPLGGEVSIPVDGDESRPTPSQRHYYREIEKRYKSLRNEIAPELLQQLRNWNVEIDRDDVWKTFVLEGIGIPDLDAGGDEWELTYSLQGDNRWFCVMMKGWTIQGIHIDG